MLLIPQISYTLPSGMNLGLNSEIAADWQRPAGDPWTVLLQAAASTVTAIGEVPVNLLLGARYYVKSPMDGPAWGVRAAVTVTQPVLRQE